MDAQELIADAREHWHVSDRTHHERCYELHYGCMIAKLADALEAALAPAPPREPPSDMEIIAVRKATKCHDYTQPFAETIAFARAILDLYGGVPRGDAAPTPKIDAIKDCIGLVAGELLDERRANEAWDELALILAPTAEPVAQPACAHEWRDRRTSDDPHALDTCCRCGAVRGEDEPVAQQPEAPTLTQENLVHPLALKEVIRSVQRRVNQGDCPVEPPQPREVLEEAIVEMFRLLPRMDIAKAEPQADPLVTALQEQCAYADRVVRNLNDDLAASRERERTAYERAAKACEMYYAQWPASGAPEMISTIRALIATPDSAASPTGGEG